MATCVSNHALIRARSRGLAEQPNMWPIDKSEAHPFLDGNNAHPQIDARSLLDPNRPTTSDIATGLNVDMSQVLNCVGSIVIGCKMG